MRLTGVGFFIAACIVGGTLGGLWLTGKLHTKSPWPLIAGLVIGLALAAFGVYQMLKPLMSNKQDKENR